MRRVSSVALNTRAYHASSFSIGPLNVFAKVHHRRRHVPQQRCIVDDGLFSAERETSLQTRTTARRSYVVHVQRLHVPFAGHHQSKHATEENRVHHCAHDIVEVRL
jgi:hypothetical protein